MRKQQKPTLKEVFTQNIQLTFNFFGSAKIRTLFSGQRKFQKPNENDNNTTATYIIDNDFLFIEDYLTLTKQFETSTAKVLNYMSHLLSENNSARQGTQETINRTVAIKIKDYQKLRGVKDYKETKRQLAQDIATIYKTSVKFNDTIYRKNTKGLKLEKFEMRIISSLGEGTIISSTKEGKIKATSKNGVFIINFTPEYAYYLVHTFIRKLPLYYWQANNIAADLIDYLALIRATKHNKPNQNPDGFLLKTTEVLKNIGSIPTYEEVIKSKDQHTNKRIIKPLETALDEIHAKGFWRWEYCNSKREILTDEQLAIGWDDDDNVIIGNNTKHTGKDKYYLKWKNFTRLYIKFTYITPQEISQTTPPQIQPATEPPATQEAAQINT